jgi:hypothetical protein
MMCLWVYYEVSLLRKEFGWSGTGCQFFANRGGIPGGMWFPIRLFYFKHTKNKLLIITSFSNIHIILSFNFIC